MSTPVLVEKETIQATQFKDVVISSFNGELDRQLEQAVRLGNAYHSKVGITYFDDAGMKKVVTTIWAKGEKFISLKGGVWIPISRIISVDL